MTLPITRHRHVRIERSLLDGARSRFRATGHARAVVDGQRHKCQRGAWATWIPSLGTKYLNTVNGHLDCLHHNAPTRGKILEKALDRTDYRPYSREEWKRAYTTQVSRKAAENAVAAGRLYEAGLGPRVLGLCIALHYTDVDGANRGFSMGIVSENVAALPPKRPASEEEFLAAGVTLDRLNSAIRQQVNGYVVDLNSVVGVMPVDAEDEVAAIERQLAAALGEAGREF